MTAAADPALGRMVGGQYRLVEFLAAGSMGRVYRGVIEGLQKAVAIKVMHPHWVGNESLAKRFQREARSASLFRHPHSIAIFDVGAESDGTLYLVMELLVGQSLADWISGRKNASVEDILTITHQVLAALEEAHARGIIHRDLKPQNIFLLDLPLKQPFAKVLDFGIAKLQGEAASTELTMAGTVCGTPQYMSPEQARGSAIDHRADLYAVGVMLYQMLTGQPPFRGENPLSILRQHLDDPPVPPRQLPACLTIPRELEDLVLRALAKEPERRPASATVFRRELMSVQRNAMGRTEPHIVCAPVRSVAGNAPPSSRRGLRFIGWRGVALCAVALALVVAAAAWIGLRWRVLPEQRVSTAMEAPQRPAAEIVDRIPAHVALEVSAAVAPGAASVDSTPAVATELVPNPTLALQAEKIAARKLERRGLEMFRAGDYSAAESQLSAAQKRGADSTELWETLAKIYMRRGDPTRACALYRQLVQRFRRQPERQTVYQSMLMGCVQQ